MTKRYGTFFIENSKAYWNQDPAVTVNLSLNSSKVCEQEGIWNPSNAVLRKQYNTAITGLCIWSKYDAIFKFKSVCKGNRGAERSLSSPRDKDDITERLRQGRVLECAILSENPFGAYQNKMIQWQTEVVSKFSIKTLYYSLPIDEYIQSISALKEFLSFTFYDELCKVLFKHYYLLQEKIRNLIPTEVHFIRPMSQCNKMTIENSYTWPYESNLAIELGIEEIEEVRIPYQALKLGHVIPPILLGVLDLNYNLYYAQRQVNKIIIEESNVNHKSIAARQYEKITCYE